MTREDIDKLVIEYKETHSEKTFEQLLNVFQPFLSNKSFKLKRGVTDPAISPLDIKQDLIINFLRVIEKWTPTRKCSFKTYLMWNNLGNPVRAKKRGGINYLFRKGKPVYEITSYEDYEVKIGARADENGDDSGRQNKHLSYYRMSR